MKLSIEVCSKHDITVVYCRGRIIYREEASALSEKIAEILPTTRQLVLELSGVEWIDSAGLGELVLLYLWVRAAGCSIKLAGLRDRIQRLLELTNLISVFEVYPSLEDALDSFRTQVA